jgi:CTP:molybdopterin cytidylyltransferase MocA/HD superfamily phosphodiesterase
MKIGGVIVAAGLSSRMKGFKPLLPMGDKLMIEMTINNFKLFGVDEIVVVTGYRSHDIIKKLLGCNVRFVHNVNFSSTHMFDSVALGLNEIKTKVDMVFISPSDSPFVQQFTLKTMMEEMRNNKFSLIQPSYEGENGHPLLLNKRGIEEVLNHDGKLGLQGAISKMDSISNKSFVDPGIILDADTPEDYENLIEFNKNKYCPSVELCRKIQTFFNMKDNIKAHSDKVKSTAIDIYELLSDKEIALDKNIIAAASMLHDIARSCKGHALVGAEWLKDMGYYEVSEIVREHMVLDSISKEITEKEVVFVADKLVQDDYSVTIEEKYNIRKEMFKGNKEAILAIERKKNQALEIYELIYNKIGGRNERNKNSRCSRASALS